MNPGSIVRCRNRDWVLLPGDDASVYRLRPPTGATHEVVAVHKQLAELMGYELPEERLRSATFWSAAARRRFGYAFWSAAARRRFGSARQRIVSPEEELRKRLIATINTLGPDDLEAADRFLARLASNQSPAIRGGVIQSGVEPPHSKDWPHAPVHRLGEAGTFIVTAGTWRKQHHFRGPERLGRLESELLTLAKQFGWRLEAWAVFSNHYHFVGHSPPDPAALGVFLGALHTKTAAAVNQMDGVPGRKVWHNFWETKLTFERSYLARLHYVHQNPVKHGLVRVASQYPFCSAAWFERTATPAQVKTIYSFKTDKLRVLDDFEPAY